MKKVMYLFLILCGLAIVACGTIYEPEPVGIGKEYSELKRSPCACLELKKAPQLPDWMV